MYSNQKYKYGNRKFWAEGYYVSTVGLNESTIRKYNRKRESHYNTKDKLLTKEYTNLFENEKNKQNKLAGSGNKNIIQLK